MKKDKEIRTELEEWSPLLSNMKKQGNEDGFQVPFNFFEELPDLILEQAKTEQSVMTRTSPRKTWQELLKNTITLLFQPRYAVGFATIALLIVGIFYIMPHSSIEKTAFLALEEISSEELDAYISEHLEDFQEEILEEEASVDIFENNGNLQIEDAELNKYFDEIIDEVELENLL